MTDPRQRPEAVGIDNDDALDHALRERPVDDDTDFDFDDDPSAASGVGHPPPPKDADASDSHEDDDEDYVLYSEVRPHLEALVALQQERTKMIDLLLYARDRVSSPAVASRMDDNLAQLGIEVIVPAVGDRFDAQRHEASATVFSDDASLHGRIAEIELAGYADGDRLVRHPIVTVYTAERDGSA